MEAGLEKAEACSTALDEILQLARHAGDRVSHIASASQEQTQVAEQVAQSMHSIADFTQHAVAAGEQAVMACNDLASLATDLERHSMRFTAAQLTQARCKETTRWARRISQLHLD